MKKFISIFMVLILTASNINFTFASDRSGEIDGNVDISPSGQEFEIDDENMTSLYVDAYGRTYEPARVWEAPDNPNFEEDEKLKGLQMYSAALPNEIYLCQETSYTCTLSSAAMMMRGRMYLSGNSLWTSITESSISSVAWAPGSGLYWSFDYSIGGNSISVRHTSTSGISASALKSLLDSHPEGIELYCGNLPHAVYLTDYEGDTFYCADPNPSYSGIRRTLASSSLGVKYGSQSNVLNNVTAYWYVASYSIANNSDIEPPVISNVSITNVDRDGYTVNCTVTDNKGLNYVQFPAWTDYNGQDDLYWHHYELNGETAVNLSYRINRLDHNNEFGVYHNHIYAWDNAGNISNTAAPSFNLFDYRYHIDYPADNDNVFDEDLPLQGWSISTVAVAKVQYSINGGEWNDFERYDREDVRNALTGYIIGSEGFRAVIPKYKLKNGANTVSMVTKYEDGSVREMGTRTVNVKYDYVPRACVVSTANNLTVYCLYDYEMSREDAADLCTELGGKLATIHKDNEVIDEIVELIQDRRYYVSSISGSIYGNDSADKTGFILEIPMQPFSYARTIVFNGSRYSSTYNKMPYSAAKCVAEYMGGHLAVITSEEENAAVSKLANEGMYIGLSDEKEEGSFEWVTGEAVNYTNWAEGQPDNYEGIQDYACITSDGTWDDCINAKARGWIIEIEEKKPVILWGDADKSNTLTANDAAAILQYSLNKAFAGVENYDYTYCDVNDDGIITANDASNVVQKTLNSEFKFAAE